MAVDFKLSLVLQAAEMLEQPKMSMLSASTPMLRARRPAPPAFDDDVVPDMSVGATPRMPRHRSPFAYDDDAGASDDASSGMDSEEHASKRARLASSRLLNARNADTHNSVEKRRRAYLASCYDGLRDVVPVLACSRASNVKVLRSAAAYIKTLEADERRMVQEKKRLLEQQRELLRERERRMQETEAAAMMVPVLAAPYARPMRRTSSDNDVAFTLMQLARTASA